MYFGQKHYFLFRNLKVARYFWGNNLFFILDFSSSRKLEERQHFVDTEHHYSLQDLIDVESGVLGTWLGQVSLDLVRYRGWVVWNSM